MVAAKLVVLISPTDRQHDAIRLTEAGVRVVATALVTAVRQAPSPAPRPVAP
jgi:hypothetical protein